MGKIYIIVYNKKNANYVTLFCQYNVIKVKINLCSIKFNRLYKNKILAIFYYYFCYFNCFFFVSKNIISQY